MTKRTLLDQIILDWFSQTPKEKTGVRIAAQTRVKKGLESSNPNVGPTPEIPLVKATKGPDFGG